MLLLIICFLLPCLSRTAGMMKSSAMEMTALSVGHGQAIVLSAPTGEHILFDAGSITNQDIARKTIVPYLQYHSIFTLDAVYISHGDMDHLDAVPDVIAAVPVQHIYGNAALLENAKQPSLEKQLTERLKQLRLELEPVQNRQYGGVKIQSLWPVKEIVSDQGISENDRSEVLLIEYAGRKILLCGDTECYAQKKFMELYPGLKVDVMVLPHHGSTTNLDTGFIEQLSPSIVIASCSAKNAPAAYQPPNHAHVQSFDTALDGAITVKIKADGALSAAGFVNSQQKTR